MLHRYDPDFKGFYNYVCAGCEAESNAKADLIQHKLGCLGKADYVFGPRIAQAVVICSLNYGKEEKDGLPFSYIELVTTFPEAVASAERALLPLIEGREEAKRKKKLSEEIGRLLAEKTLQSRPKPAPRQPVQLKLELGPTLEGGEVKPQRKPPKRDFSSSLRGLKSVKSIFEEKKWKKLGTR